MRIGSRKAYVRITLSDPWYVQKYGKVAGWTLIYILNWAPPVLLLSVIAAAIAVLAR